MWQKYKFEENKTYSTKIGRTRLWVEKQQKIWRIASQIEESGEFSSDGFVIIQDTPENIPWNQYVGDKNNTLLLVPNLPDKPVVIKPDVSFTIMAGMNLDIYVKIPLWIQLYSTSVKPGNLLFEQGTTELSLTWFGDPTNGELAYSLPSSIIQKMPATDTFTGEAICPIRIRNESQSILNFQRLSVDTNELNVYANQNLICTNEVKVRFKGEEHNSEVQIIQGSPTLAEGLKQIGYARSKPDKNLLRKSFYFIKSFTQY